MIIAATGHRPNKLGGYGPDIFDRLTRLAIDYLADQKDVSHVISGMALGWDQAFAWAAELLSIPFVAAVPFYGQESRWPKRSQERYHELLSFAAEIVCVEPGGYEAWKMQRRNEWMVNRADKICALWDRSFGGTRNCVVYAQQCGKKIENQWPNWLRLSEKDVCRSGCMKR